MWDFLTSRSEHCIKADKNGKAPSLDALPAEFWKVVRKILTKFCNKIYKGTHPDPWGLSGFNPNPKERK